MEQISTTIASRRFYRNEATKTNGNTSIELPEEIKRLITGSDYWRRAKENRYKKLIREGQLQNLMLLAETAATKGNQANWFAKAASKAQWERTLAFLAKLREVMRAAEEIAQRIKATPAQMRVVYKACWRFGAAAVQKAVTAQETGTNPFRYFCWLVSKKVSINSD